ncbi:MAG: LamG domain-containing protein, partial [Planctomycetes bacterium]|nr:LamG domain-containing protein [Planctomycetota bacterium]
AQGSAAFEGGTIGSGLNLDHAPDTLTSDKTEGAYVSVPLVLGEKGTIALWYYVEPYYNYQSIWDNSVHSEDWEMWIYNDGRLRGRIDGGSGDITYDLDNLRGPGHWYHIAFAWDRVGQFADLIIDGHRVGGGAISTWVVPGDTFFLGGGNPNNMFGTGIFDEVRIYDAALNEDEVREILYEGMPPGVYLPLDGDAVNHGTWGEAYDGVLSSGANGEPRFIPTLHGQGLWLDNDRTKATDGAFLSVENPLREKGTIALWYFARDFYNYQTVFDNDVEANDWEMWIYNDGRVRGRIDAGSGELTCALADLEGPNHWYHIVYTWDRPAAEAGLWVNGANIAVGGIGNWIEPGAMFHLGGGHPGNTYGHGVWDEVRIYDRVVTEVEIAALASEEPVCPPDGDTHILKIDVTGPKDPRGNIPGSYAATATATDDSGDPIIYTFVLADGAGPILEVGPQDGNVVTFDLAEGEWTITAIVDDNLFCPDEAEDAVASASVVVGPACPEAGDTHVTALDIAGPTNPLGNIPGTYTATATAVDDSGDAISYTFVVDDGSGPILEVGPQAGNAVTFDLAEGTFTITVSVDDDVCTDVAEDAVLSKVVEVGPAGVGPFIRGDCNGDRRVGISDAVASLMYAYDGSFVPPCIAACDADGNGSASGTPVEAIYILTYQFLGGPAPVAPFPACGISVEPSDAALGCENPTCEP